MLNTLSTPDEALIEAPSARALAPSAPLRILFHVVDFGRGGTETALVGWLQALQSDRFTAAICTAYPSREFDEIYRSQLPADLSIHLLHAHPLLYRLHQKKRDGSLGAVGKFARSVLNATFIKYWSKRQMRRIASGYDIIVDFDLSLRHLAGKFDRPWVGVSHFSFAARLTGRRKKIARLAAQYRRYDAIAVLNQAMASEAATLFGNEIQRVMVLPNTVDVTDIQRRATAPLPAAMVGIDVPYIVSVARLEEGQKDHRTLIAAYVQLLRTSRIAEDLVIVGDGPDRAMLEAVAHASGQGDRIHFIGFLSNPHPVVAGASALVLSTRYEGLGMVLIEALALGKPVVCSDCPTGPREVLDDGRAGLLVPCGDVDALCEALGRAIGDAVLRETLAAAAPARAAFYGSEASVQRLATYCEILTQQD